MEARLTEGYPVTSTLTGCIAHFHFVPKNTVHPWISATYTHFVNSVWLLLGIIVLGISCSEVGVSHCRPCVNGVSSLLL